MAYSTSVFVELFAGGIAGAAGIIATQPMDTLRIRLQTGGYKGIANCLNETLKNEGIRGLYKGVASPVLTVGLMNSVLFLSYNYTLSYATQAGKTSTASQIFIAGSLSGILSACINSPTELVKCLSQINLQSRGYLREEYEVFRKLLHDYGFNNKGIMRGLHVTMLRDVPSYGIYFSTYDIICKYFGDEAIVHLIGGGICGQISWAITYPLDIVKTRWQIAPPGTYKSLSHCIQSIYESGGGRAFSRGFGTTMLKAFPQNAVLFGTYEAMKSSLS